jgi:hypothetical protein
MKEWILALLILEGVSAAVMVPLAICICIGGWPSGDEQVDEENPPSLDQSRGARASHSRGLGIDFFLLILLLLSPFSPLSPISVV